MVRAHPALAQLPNHLLRDRGLVKVVMQVAQFGAPQFSAQGAKLGSKLERGER